MDLAKKTCYGVPALMNAPNILFLQGGWDVHKPEQIIQKFKAALVAKGCKTETLTSLERLADTNWLKTFDVISPCWTMGKLSAEESAGLRGAVHSGVGLGGFHGGMGDAFRGDLDYEWMVGGHFVGHPYVGDYIVRVTQPSDVIMQEMPPEFPYNSEQYYMLMDPGVRVLAEAAYTFEERTCAMPVVWTKHWGNGRVFYSSLGHDPTEFDQYPVVFDMSLKGIIWAAKTL